MGGGEVLTEFRDGGGGARGGSGIQSQRQRAFAGVDVAATGEGLADWP